MHDVWNVLYKYRFMNKWINKYLYYIIMIGQIKDAEENINYF